LSSHFKRDVNVVHIEDIRFKNKILREGIKWKKDFEDFRDKLRAEE
jgi:hypothetical protein